MDDLLFDKGIVEQRGRVRIPNNILNDKEFDRARTISRKQYLTISVEIDNKVSKAKIHQKTICSKQKTIYGQFPCIVRTKLALIEDIKQLKKECSKTKYHQKRCIKKCNVLILFLEQSVNRMTIQLQKVKKSKIQSK